jgi:hypothetical protein
MRQLGISEVVQAVLATEEAVLATEGINDPALLSSNLAVANQATSKHGPLFMKQGCGHEKKNSMPLTYIGIRHHPQR